jgi:Flp pilus assembly pilin Flp
MVRNLTRSIQGYLVALRREEAQTFVEYALVLVLVAVAVSMLVAWTNFDNAISTALSNVTSHF